VRSAQTSLLDPTVSMAASPTRVRGVAPMKDWTVGQALLFVFGVVVILSYFRVI
jgi:hypothetical protein